MEEDKFGKGGKRIQTKVKNRQSRKGNTRQFRQTQTVLSEDMNKNDPEEWAKIGTSNIRVNGT